VRGRIVDLGQWTEKTLDELLRSARRLPGEGGRIGYLSKYFLGIGYQAGTLVGSASVPEQLVISLASLDCFTLLDYLEAMRRSASFADFVEALSCVRYRHCVVDYRHRHHFFSDWTAYQRERIDDITDTVADAAVVVVEKQLNRKADGSAWVPGIEAIVRTVTYLPSEKIDEGVLGMLRTGDYIGVYSEAEGLDVSHVGVVVKGPFVSYLRHASSSPDKKRVLDEELRQYLEGKPGIVVYRAK